MNSIATGKRLILPLLLLVALLVPVAFAQETTAALQGYVKDPSGALIAGAKVEVTSPALIGDKSVTTDASGYYRFNNLPVGVYTLSVSAGGFTSYRQTGIELLVGKLPTINVGLKLGAASETVEVSGAAPIVDATTSKVQVQMDDTLIDAVPKGRSFQSLIAFAPGARDEPLMGGYVIDGASKSENSYLIEGQETASVYSGTSNTNFPIEFIQELQVKSSGFEAEFGGALGGVVNVVQKRGSNQWHGSVFSYYSGDALDSAPNRSLRQNPLLGPTGRFDTPIEVVQPLKDHYRVVEPGFQVGGPILKDKWWVFLSSVPRISSLTRTINDQFIPTGTTAPVGKRTFAQDSQTYYSFARTDAALTNKIRVFGSWQYNYNRVKGASLPSADFLSANYNSNATSNPDQFNSGIGYVQPNVIFGAGADITITPTLIATFRFGRTYNDYQDRGLPVGIRYQYQVSAVNVKGLDGTPVPANLQNGAGFATMGANSATQYDQFFRKSFNQDIAWFKRAWGTHNFKGGYLWSGQANNVSSGYNTAYVRLYWGRQYTPLAANQANCAAIRAQNQAAYGQPGGTATSCRGDYGYFYVRDLGTFGKVSGSNQALYFQDAWTVGKGVTLNLGVRSDSENLPSYLASFKGISFPWSQKMAPRLGAAWDVLQNGKVKVYGSFGLFYDIMKINLPSGSFGGDYWHNCYYALDSPNFSTNIIPSGTHVSGNCPLGTGPANGTFNQARFIENQDFREPANDPTNYLVDPNLKPMRQREYTAGVDWALKSNIALEVRYNRKRLDRTIEDAGIVTPAGEQFYIVNPGEGINKQPIPATDCTGCPTQPGVIRDYDGVEFRLTKRASSRWFGVFSYTYSRFNGNYNGLATADVSDGLGRANPNNNRSFDESYMQFDTNGKVINGPLDTDRPNTFKMTGYYRLPWLGMHTLIGMNQFMYQGTPLHSYLYMDGSSPQIIAGRGYFVPITQNATTGDWIAGTPVFKRMPWYTQTDLNLVHEVQLSKTNEALKLVFEGNVTNLFNQHAVTNIDTGAVSGNTGNLTLSTLSSIPGLPATSISGVNYKALMTGYNWQAVANGNGAILSSTYGMANGWQTGRSMRFKVGFTF